MFAAFQPIYVLQTFKLADDFFELGIHLGTLDSPCPSQDLFTKGSSCSCVSWCGCAPLLDECLEPCCRSIVGVSLKVSGWLLLVSLVILICTLEPFANVMVSAVQVGVVVVVAQMLLQALLEEWVVGWGMGSRAAVRLLPSPLSFRRGLKVHLDVHSLVIGSEVWNVGGVRVDHLVSSCSAYQNVVNLCLCRVFATACVGEQIVVVFVEKRVCNYIFRVLDHARSHVPLGLHKPKPILPTVCLRLM